MIIFDFNLFLKLSSYHILDVLKPSFFVYVSNGSNISFLPRIRKVKTVFSFITFLFENPMYVLTLTVIKPLTKQVSLYMSTAVNKIT